jgi:hypothetical protein
MNSKIKIILVLLTGLVFFYTGCKQENVPGPKPVPVPVVDTISIAINQITRNLVQTLSGTYGGVNINKGLILPDYTTRNNSKVALKGLLELCTFGPDTLLNYSTNVGDSIKSQTRGLAKFYFSCDTAKAPRVNGYPVFSVLNGYSSYDSLSTIGLAPRGAFVYEIKAFYTAKAVVTRNIPLTTNGSTNSVISFSGGIQSFVDTSATKKTATSSSVHAYYTLTDVVVDITKKGDMTGGSLTFSVIGEGNNVKWYYPGTMKFLGNHKVNIIIRNKTYNMDLLTGKITAT